MQPRAQSRSLRQLGDQYDDSLAKRFVLNQLQFAHELVAYSHRETFRPLDGRNLLVVLTLVRKSPGYHPGL